MISLSSIKKYFSNLLDDIFNNKERGRLDPNSWYRVYNYADKNDRGFAIRTDMDGDIIPFKQKGDMFLYDNPIKDFELRVKDDFSDRIRDFINNSSILSVPFCMHEPHPNCPVFCKFCGDVITLDSESIHPMVKAKILSGVYYSPPETIVVKPSGELCDAFVKQRLNIGDM